MKNQIIGLGDLFNQFLRLQNYEIKDKELLDSLNEHKLFKTDGLDLFYKIKDERKYPVPQINASTFMETTIVATEEFERFWNMYNKKTGKEKVIKRWSKLTSKEREKIFETLPYYLKYTPDVKFRKDPYTYLNQRTWEDEVYMPTKRDEPVINNPFKW